MGAGDILPDIVRVAEFSIFAGAPIENAATPVPGNRGRSREEDDTRLADK